MNTNAKVALAALLAIMSALAIFGAVGASGAVDEQIVEIPSEPGESVLGDGTVVTVVNDSLALAGDDCPNGNGCGYQNGGFGGAQLNINPGSASETPWVAPGFLFRSGRNRYSDRRLLFANMSGGTPVDRICIPAGEARPGPFAPARSHMKAGAKDANPTCN